MRLIKGTNIRMAYINIPVLILLLGIVASKHLSLHTNTLTLGESDPQTWIQPEYLNAQYPTLISKNTWSLSFTQIESIIQTIPLDSNQKVIITSDLTEKLSQILFQLGSKPESTQWQRLEFLLTKQFGENPGKELHQLIANFYYYQNESMAYSNKIKLANNTEKKSLLENSMNMLIKMQLRYFSRDTAVKLFDKKNKTTHYLNSIRIISMDKTLSNIDKKARLSKISNDYKRSLSQR